MKNRYKDDEKEIIEGKSQFGEVLETTGTKIVKLDLSKQRPVSTNSGTYNLEKFAKYIRDSLGPRGALFPEVFKALHDLTELENMLVQYAKEKSLIVCKGKGGFDVPEVMKGLTLNFDLSAQCRDNKFFLTDVNEQVVLRISGEAYLLVHNMKQYEAVAQSRCVIPEYLPREDPGVFSREIFGRIETVFNAYVQPPWRLFHDWDRLPDKIPSLVKKLVEHLFEDPDDRQYFWDWTFASLFNRAPVFLVLCGDPGIGKNRLKLLLRALHGHSNTIDGKKSTITEKFNGQIPCATLLWFDELQYDLKMENAMKELTNDSLSIERKGVDSTRGTRVHASFAISNNKPRDNYIFFDSRKFAPLKLTKKRLEKSMGEKEINDLTKKLEDQDSSTYDVSLIAQTAKWLQARGSSGKWPNLEYRGPMFWHLANTSMTQWQKEIVTQLSEICRDKNRRRPNSWDKCKRAFLWSAFRSSITDSREKRDVKLPDFTTVQVFLDAYRDKNGTKIFETILVPGPNIVGDFWIKPIAGLSEEGPVRDDEMSEYMWDQTKAEWESSQREGLSNVTKETDDL